MTQPATTDEERTAPDTDDFAALRKRVIAAGCFDYAPALSVLSLVAHVIGPAAMHVAAARMPWWATLPTFVAASLLFYRIGWLMHDAAHGGTFARAAHNRVFAAVCAGVLGEFPSGWRYGHGRHHAAPNVLGRDMDQSERWDPTRRFSTELGAALSLLFISKYKGVALPKTLLLIGLRDGFFCYRYARRNFARELATSIVSITAQIAFFIALYGAALGALCFFAHSFIGLVYLNAVFTGSHYDLPTFTPAEAERLEFAELQVRTTRNYPPGLWSAFVFGGIEYQIEHHLFPNMPRRGFARASREVRAFCESRGIDYQVMPFIEAVRRAMRFHVGRSESASTPST